MNHLFEILIQDTNLSATGFFILCGVSFLGSLIAGALGLGGGVLVLATMANLLSPTALVPIQHGLKIITFALLGFAFGPYIPLLVGFGESLEDAGIKLRNSRLSFDTNCL